MSGFAKNIRKIHFVSDAGQLKYRKLEENCVKVFFLKCAKTI